MKTQSPADCGRRVEAFKIFKVKMEKIKRLSVK